MPNKSRNVIEEIRQSLATESVHYRVIAKKLHVSRNLVKAVWQHDFQGARDQDGMIRFGRVGVYTCKNGHHVFYFPCPVCLAKAAIEQKKLFSDFAILTPRGS